MGNLFYDEPGVKPSHKREFSSLQIFDVIQWNLSASQYRVMECHGDDRYDLAYIGDAGCARLPADRIQLYSRVRVKPFYAMLVERDGRPV